MSFITTILGFLLITPIVIVAAVLLLGAGAGLITRVFSPEILFIAGIILVFTLIKKIFK